MIIVGVRRTPETPNMDDGRLKKLPDWAERIPSIRAALTNITTEVIDRRQIGELFGVSLISSRASDPRHGSHAAR